MRRLLLLLVVLVTAVPVSAQDSHADLVVFYDDWRDFHQPPLVDGIPDYSADAMFAQHRELWAWQARLAAFDTTGWAIPHRADWHLVQAEMNGLDFDHRVMRPWQNNPAWYVQIWTYESDTPAHEGPTPHGFIDLWTYDFPLNDDAAADLTARIQTIPPFLATARENLTGNQRDLWRMGAAVMRGQAENLRGIDAAGHPALAAAIRDAVAATEHLAAWLEETLPGKTGPSGLGIDQYNWYLEHVHLSPFTWEDELRIMQRELARSYRALRMEENRNRDLPVLDPIMDEARFNALKEQAVVNHIDFFERESIMTVAPYMEQALREHAPTWSPDGPQSFFAQVNYRDPAVMRTHDYHWIDLARMREDPHASPIRSNPLLYNIWDSRSEGLATGMEEFMMDAGLFDDKPRTRELVWILIAQRAARAISGLMMHANEWDLQQASDYAVAWTPRGWMTPNGRLVGFEQHLYLMQPGYGSSYLAGKAQMESLIADYQQFRGDSFSVKRFFDDVNASGLVPVSIIRWELTGLDDWIPSY